jgi:putative FmdB family regulatory protein
MPLYTTICKKCGSRDSIYKKIDERDNLPSCNSCDGECQRIIEAPSVHAAFQAYTSPNTGKYIESRDAQRNDLRASGAFLYEKGVEQDVARNKIRAQEKAFAPIERAIDDTVRNLVNNGKLES